MSPIREDLIGYFVAALPPRQEDIDGDGAAETVHDLARADIGPHTYELAPREFNIPELPFEVAFVERKYIQVFYQNRPLTDAEIIVTDGDGSETAYHTDSNGWISGLPIETLRRGFTASYSPDGQNVYRMYYLVEDYEYFTIGDDLVPRDAFPLVKSVMGWEIGASPLYENCSLMVIPVT